jgi:hypothetical protein
MASAGFEPVILGTRGQHANHKTTEATTELVSGEMSVKILHCSWKSRDRGKNDTGTERERE